MPDDSLDLLLAYADDQQPVLADGLPKGTCERAPRPKKTPMRDDNPHRRAVSYNRNDLRRSRWGVVIPEGPLGDELLDVMAPLIHFRQEEQAATCIVYRVPPGMDARASAEWKMDVYHSETRDDGNSPSYLMLLGDLDHVSLELQRSLAYESLPGRVHFANKNGAPDLDAYDQYVKKVLLHAGSAATEKKADVLLHGSRDGTPASQHAHAQIVAPLRELILKYRDDDRHRFADIREIEGASGVDFLTAAATSRPSILLSIAHALGAPRNGWSSEAERRAKQGALSFGMGDVLDAERLAAQPIVPGGIWIMQGSFSAATPSSSHYEPWLAKLVGGGAYGAQLQTLVRSLPSDAHRPFVAALPQAALANPKGPLAIVGQSDLAWSFGPWKSGLGERDTAAWQWVRILAAFASGNRVGLAFDTLTNYYMQANFDVASLYEEEAQALEMGRAAQFPLDKRGALWMARHDWRSYVLLGDPAVRLPLA